MAQNSISSELNNLLITHDFDVDALSTRTGKPAVNERGVPDVSEADMFSFDWVGPTGKNYGTMVILLDQNGGMTVYFGDNLGRTMDPEDKKAWYGDSETDSPGFLEQLKNFAIRTSKVRGGFGLENLSKLKYAIAGQAALTESFYGTKKVSYSGEPTEARLMIRHSRPISEGDKRYRYVDSLFIETAQGERFRLPFRKLAGGRAMLEHVRQGGNPYDLRGQHIAETVNQLNVLSQFRRAHQHRVFEGAAGELITETDQYRQRLNHNLKHMASSRGYRSYFESWKPADISEGDIMVEDLRGMFVETRIDPRIESALPMLAKIQQEARAMKEAEIFESWAERLVEGTWAMPDTPEKMTQLQDWLSQPRPLGPDAEDVTDVLYDLIGDDALFDQLAGMAEEDPDADAVPIVQAWIIRNQDQSPELSELAMSFQTTQPAEPEAAPAPTEPAPVAEGSDDSKEREENLRYSRSRNPVADAIRKKLNPNQKEQNKEQGVAEAGPFSYGKPPRKGSVADLAAKKRKEQERGQQPIEPKDQMVGVAKVKKGVAEGLTEMDKSQTPPGRDGGTQFSPGPKVSKKDREAAKKDPAKHLSDLFAKEYAKKKQGVAEGHESKQEYHDRMHRIAAAFKDMTPAMHAKRKKIIPGWEDQYQEVLDYVKKNPNKQQGVEEGDNLQTFEDIIRLSGAPMNENVMTDHTRHTLKHILHTFGRDVRDFIQNGELSAHLYDALYDYYHEDMPYGVAKARTGDPYEWISDRLSRDLSDHGMLDETVPTIAATATPEFNNDPAPVNECNYTMENEYCPVHGLAECSSTSMFESELARIKSLSLLK